MLGIMGILPLILLGVVAAASIGSAVATGVSAKKQNEAMEKQSDLQKKALADQKKVQKKDALYAKNVSKLQNQKARMAAGSQAKIEEFNTKRVERDIRKAHTDLLATDQGGTENVFEARRTRFAGTPVA